MEGRSLPLRVRNVYRAEEDVELPLHFMQTMHGAAHTQSPEPQGTAVLEGEHAEAHLAERLFVRALIKLGHRLGCLFLRRESRPDRS